MSCSITKYLISRHGKRERMRKSRVTIVRLQIKQRFIGRERSNYGFAYENVRVTGGLGVRHERIGGIS